MAVSGTVSAYYPHKGFGFIECNGQDVFVHKTACPGRCLAKGQQVSFGITQGEKGAQATDVTVQCPPEEALYLGEVKSFNGNKGYGFIGCEGFPGTDVFVLKSECPGGFAPQGGQCCFKVKMDEKGPSAAEVRWLGSAGNQFAMMRQMWAHSKGMGKGWGKSSRGPRVDPAQKVWIGNLPEGTKWKDLQEHMNAAGKTKWCEVFSGKGAGTGSAAYTSVEDAAKAVKEMNGSTFGAVSIVVDVWQKTTKE
eukprot:TRINITY_DN2913_c0_g1_i2.p1 TRINITY_DN2913_c0_g1~~TRINITY_DN2913_c0_g1_i2.p1  ORF type:complete len:250 (-),score=67.92 TRINITY_DN2913_c0_g1_i2:112-861(-)